MSDLHGGYGSYLKMMDRIGFSDGDTMIIDGDICDRGREPTRIYLDAMRNPNVICLKGNHELMAENVLPYMLGYKRKKARSIYKFDVNNWLANGGDSTIMAIYQHRDETKCRIVDFIVNMPYHTTVKVGEREFIITHAGLGGFSPTKSLDEYDPYELVWDRPNYDAQLWEDKNRFLIVGHTPTIYINRDASPKIYHGKGNIIAIDCGEAYRAFGGRLGCICLDTMEEFYV